MLVTKQYFRKVFSVLMVLGSINLWAQTNLNIRNLNENSKCLVVDTFFEFPKELQETSALIYTHGYFWTVNDGGNDPILYALYNPFKETRLVQNKKDVIALKINLPVSNVDYEALASDSEYIYIGDFGNNLGSRKDLRIYVFKIKEVLANNIQYVDTIHFEFEDQTEFKPRRLHAFDCESMVIIDQTIYLFSKNWNNLKTNVYTLKNRIKYQKASKIISWDPHFYVTDACFVGGTIFLSGYNYLGNQFLYRSNWKKGKTSKIDLKPAQIEGICVLQEIKTGELSCYLTTEKRKSQPAGIFKLVLNR